MTNISFQINDFSLTAMASNAQDIVFAYHAMPQRIFDEEKTRIKWFSLWNYDLQTTTKTIKQAVADQTQAKNIVVSAYQKYAATIDNEVILDHIFQILEVWRGQKKNKVLFGTCLFEPEFSHAWEKVAKLNDGIRLYNLCMGMSPLNLHKMAMTTISETDFSLRTKPGCYADFQLGLGVGKYPSPEMLIRLKGHLITVFDNAFTGKKDPDGAMAKTVRIKIPPPLAATPGYMINPFFKQCLQDRNLVSRNEEEALAERLTFSQWKPTGWKYWYLYRYGHMETKEDREAALQYHLEEILQSSPRPTWGQEEIPMENLVIEVDNDACVPKKSTLEDEERVIRAVNESSDSESSSDSSDSSDEDSEDSSDEDESSKGEKEKRKCNENQLLAEYKRAAEVNEELADQYKQELNIVKVQVQEQKAAAREWRKQAEQAEHARKEVFASNKAMERQISVLEEQVNRMRKEYKFLRSLYEDGSSRRITGRRYAKEEDWAMDDK